MGTLEKGSIYIVIGIPNEHVPAFHVQKQSGSKAIKTLHRNMLLPFSAIPGIYEAKRTFPKQNKTVVRTRNEEKVGTQKSESESSDTDSSGEVPRYVIPPKRRSDSWSRSSRDTNWRHRSSDTGPNPVTQTPFSHNPVPQTPVSNTAHSPVHIPILTSPDTNPIYEEPVFIPDSPQHMSAPVST